MITTLISSCGLRAPSDASKETSFNSLFPNCAMNTIITFLPPQPNYKFDDYINLSYQNLSENQIVLPPGSGVRIFVYQEANWLELNNNMQYSVSPEPYLVLEPKGELASYGDIVISPDIWTQIVFPTEIRVVITAHNSHDEKATDDCVGAFIDVRP